VSVSDVDRYVFVWKLLESIYSMLPTFIHTYKGLSFLKVGYTNYETPRGWTSDDSQYDRTHGAVSLVRQ
jgi:hypothetical protein